MGPIKIVEVSLRDGLQNVKQEIPTEVKAGLLDRLGDTGLKVIEATSFVSPKWVPQLRDGVELMQMCSPQEGIAYTALVPNMQGYHKALAVGFKEVAIFTAASDKFCQNNINCSIDESFQRYLPVLEQAKRDQVLVRGYVSCALGSPYPDDPVSPEQVARVAHWLYENGCYEVSIGDTIGRGTACEVKAVIKAVSEKMPVSAIAAHFHNTYGQALPNIREAVELGVLTVDASVAGLGGCPYAPGASGNVATEDVVFMLEGMGYETGVDLNKIIAAGQFITNAAQLTNHSMVAKAMLSTAEAT